MPPKERMICTMCSTEIERDWVKKTTKGGRGKSVHCPECGAKMLRKLCIQNLMLRS